MKGELGIQCMHCKVKVTEVLNTAKGQFEELKDIQTRNEKSGKGERGPTGSFIEQ